MSDTESVLNDVYDEVARARAKFPAMNGAHEGYAVILEELDELWEEVRHKSDDRPEGAMRDEAIQIAAMAVRFVQDVCDVAVPSAGTDSEPLATVESSSDQPTTQAGSSESDLPFAVYRDAQHDYRPVRPGQRIAVQNEDGDYVEATAAVVPAEGQSADLPRITGLDNYTLAALRKVSQEREDAIRVKLIELGWTPPGDGPGTDERRAIEACCDALADCLVENITETALVSRLQSILLPWADSELADTESRDVPPDHSGACTRNAEGECMSMHCPTCGKIWHGGGPCPAVVEAATDATCDHIYPAHGATKDIACVECGEPHPDAGTVYKVTREEGLGGPGSGGPADARRVSEGGQGPTHDDVPDDGWKPFEQTIRDIYDAIPDRDRKNLLADLMRMARERQGGLVDSAGASDDA